MSVDPTNKGAAHLSEQIGRLADEAAVVRVLHEYAEALDHGLAEQFAECFTSDAVFEIRVPEPIPADYPTRGGRIVPGAVRYTGRAEIMEFFAQHTHAPEAAHKHVVTNAIVDLDGDVARCRSYFQRTDVSTETQNFIRVFGRYVDELHRSEAKWRIARRVAEPDSIDLRSIRVDGPPTTKDRP